MFILSGAACGSTLLHEVISASNNVAIATNRWAREGMRLPLVREWLHYNGQYNWKHQPAFNWTAIHRALLQYWDPRKAVFLDKAPIYLFQAKGMAEEFAPAYFICLHRNPYSQIESYLRKSTMDIDECITYTLDTLIQQKHYLEQFDSAFGVSYTQLTDNTAETLKQLSAWLPEIGHIELKSSYGAH
ncbi:MAG: sulfotransferase, partial [Bacteroidota bacterium]